MKISTIIQFDEKPSVSVQASQDISTCLSSILSDIKRAQTSRTRDITDNQEYLYKLEWFSEKMRAKENIYNCNFYTNFVSQILESLGKDEITERIIRFGFYFLNIYVHKRAFGEVSTRFYYLEKYTREKLEGMIAIFYVFLLMPFCLLQKITENVRGATQTPLRLFHKKENNLRSTIKKLDSEISKCCTLLRHLNVDNHRLYSAYVLYFISTLYVDHMIAYAKHYGSHNADANKSRDSIVNKIYDALLEAEYSFKFTNSEVLFMEIKKTSILYHLFRSIETNSLKFLVEFEALKSDDERIAFVKKTSFAECDCAPLFYFLCFDDEAREMWNNLVDKYDFLKNSAKNKRGVIYRINAAYKFMLENKVFPSGIDQQAWFI